jgi:hypothetical protein
MRLMKPGTSMLDTPGAALKAVQTAIGFNHCRLWCERRLDVTEALTKYRSSGKVAVLIMTSGTT